MLQARLRRLRGAGEAGSGFCRGEDAGQGRLRRESRTTRRSSLQVFDGRCRADGAGGVSCCFRWRDDLRVVPCFRRDCAVREGQVWRERVLRSGVDAGWGRLRRESRTTRRSSLQVVDGRCRADGAMGVFLCFRWRDDLRVVPCFRRDCAVREGQVWRERVFAVGCGCRTGAALPRESDDTEVIPPSGRWALPRRWRGGRLLVFQVEG